MTIKEKNKNKDKKNQQKLKLHFRRLEFKYFISRGQYVDIRKLLSYRMNPDPYGGSNSSYRVNSLYYDSPGMRYYFENEAGLKNRQKIRHRYYNDDTDKLFWEIKRKKGDVVVKDRCLAADPKDAVERQLSFFTARHRLKPKLWVSYLREPWILPGNNLRVTFDQGLEAAKFQGSGKMKPDWMKRIYLDKVILEIKYSGKLPFWLYQLITRYSLERQAIGKYRLAVEKLWMV